MNWLLPGRTTILRAVILGTALTIPAAGVLAQDSLPQQSGAPAAERSDGQIEMDVVGALDKSEALKNDLITAATIQSQVTLSGTVSSDASKQLAESIVSKVPGVTKVNNHLKVGNPADAQNDMNAQQAADPGDDGGGPATDAQGQNQGQYQNQSPNQNSNDGPGRNQQGAQGGQQPVNQPPAGNYPQQSGNYPQQNQNYPQQNGQQPDYARNGYPPPPPPRYGQQPGYPPPPGYGQRPGYQRPVPRYSIPNGPVTVPQGTVLDLRTVEELDNKRAKDGAAVEFIVIRDVTLNGWLAVPRGATVHGVVTESKSAGELGGTPVLALRLVSLDLGGRSYPLNSDEFRVRGPNKAGRTAGNIVGGALLGAIIGGAAGGGGGAAIGAAAGGTVGTAASAAGPGPRAWIPAEAQVTFHLNEPLTVDPVSQEEASRLSQGLYQGGPSLYRRDGYSPYGPGYYAYPQVYYRPHYMMGGYYYWR